MVIGKYRTLYPKCGKEAFLRLWLLLLHKRGVNLRQRLQVLQRGRLHGALLELTLQKLRCALDGFEHLLLLLLRLRKSCIPIVFWPIVAAAIGFFLPAWAHPTTPLIYLVSGLAWHFCGEDMLAGPALPLRRGFLLCLIPCSHGIVLGLTLHQLRRLQLLPARAILRSNVLLAMLLKVILVLVLNFLRVHDG